MVPTILVLDRNSTVQRVMKLALKEESVQVNAVQRSGDAFAAIEAHPPDMIFTDDARKIVAFLKSRPQLSHIPVVLLKGAFDSSTAGSGEELADEVLMKPLQPDALIDCVKRLLRAWDGARPKAESLPPPPERVDAELDLEQYFDQLDVLFTKADGMSSELEEDIWDGRPASAADGREKRPAVARGGLERAAPTPQIVTNELIDQVTQRVLDRLGERIVRSTATEVVSRLSKWLLVNEIERSRNPQ